MFLDGSLTTSGARNPKMESRRWQSSHRVIALGLLMLSMATGLLAQGRYDGQPIQAIEYRGLVTLGEETLEHYLFGRQTGDEERRLDSAELNNRIHRLWKRELINFIRVEVEPVTGGIKLILTVEERPLLISVDYVGIKRVSRSDILEQVDRDRIQVYESQPLKPGELNRLKKAIEGLYQEKGYRFAEVSYVLEDLAKGQKRAIFTIDEGDKVKIGDIDFDGNTVFNDLRLRLAMKKTKKSGPISRFTKKDIYNPANVEEDLEKIREIYRKTGYKDVLVGKPEISVSAKRPDAPTIKEQKRRLEVTIPVEEGDRWRLGEITIEGNEVFSDELLLRQFEKPRGGWLRSKVVDDGLEKLEKLYQSVGYIFSEIDTELREREENSKVADLIVHVSEKDQFRVGRIEFEGNTKTQDKVLRREMLVHESTTMSMTALQNSLLKIRQLNYFALNEDEPIQFDFDGENKTVDIKVQGEEAERTELQFGGGFSELDGFFGQFAMRTTNFLGRGETFGVSAQIGRQRELFDLEYRIPWFLDKPQFIGFRAFNQSLDSRVLSGVDFEQEFSGGSITYGRNLRNFQSLSVTYSFSDVIDIRRAFNDDDEEIRQEFDFKSSSIRPTWLRNTLDSPYQPTRGLRLQASVEYAGTFLGGDTDYVRPIGSGTWFKPISRNPFKSYFGVNLEGGYIAELGDDSELFPQQLFFLGGENSVRGFRRRSIVVREEDGTIRRDTAGFPQGGTRFLQFNLEYHIEMGGPFRLVFFNDWGGVFDEDQDIDFGLMRSSAGAELRINVPLFPAPLRFIYATNLDPLEDDQFESFDFSLSTSF